MKERYKEEDLCTLKQRTIFFDANILVSLYFIIDPGDWAQNNYSRVFSKLLNQGNNLVIDVIVISEVLNRALRMEYSTYLTKNNIDGQNESFKTFRNNEQGKTAIQKTYDMMRNAILPRFNVEEKGWRKQELDELLDYDGDFNDQLIEHLCKEKKYVLLTNDADFQDANVEILSLNKRLV